MRVLVVEDDPGIAQALVRGLTADGFAVDHADDGTEGLWLAQTHPYSAIVLDLMLPGTNGWQICAALREAGDTTPILMLTAKDGEYDEIEGLETGADDYMTKPFSYPVLLTRVRSLIRRAGASPTTLVLQAGDLTLDPAARTVHRGETEVELSPRAFAVLEYMMNQAGLVVSKQSILANVWDHAFDGDPNIVEVYVSRIRTAITARLTGQPSKQSEAWAIASPQTAADMHSVRLRITLIAAITTAIAVALSGFLLIGRLDSSLAQEIDDSLERQALNYTNELFVFDDLATQPVPNDLETLLVVLDVDGYVYLANDLGVDGAEVAAQLRFDPVLQEDIEFADLSLQTPTETSDSSNLRAAYYEFFLEDQGAERYIAVIARSDESAERTVAAVRRALFVGVPVLVAFVAALAWWLTGRSLRPVDQMRREVDAIRSSDLTQRVSEPRSTDEIGQLAATMNGMLGRLEQAQRSQDQFVSDAAHELRTPLASIAAQIDVDAAHPASADRVATATNVRAEVSRLQALIDGLLASARNQEQVGPTASALVDLDVLATEAAGRVARPPSIELGTSAIGIGTIRGDQTALASLVDNLLANAYRHAANQVELSVGTDEIGVWLTVDDDGEGVEPADSERIFDRFVRLDEARTKDAGGSGLGLALARETAVRHGGTLHVETSALGGARFALRLPEAG